jgi:hypothetical protein
MNQDGRWVLAAAKGKALLGLDRGERSMPVLVSYPGVYVQEIPSGVRTITGVATSITAFVGRALYGPDDVPVTVNSFGDFERIFGGLWTGSNLGYAVRDFFQNGGGQAIIVRLYNPETGATAKAAKSKLKVGDFHFEAADKGAWGANLRATIDITVSVDVATQMETPCHRARRSASQARYGRWPMLLGCHLLPASPWSEQVKFEHNLKMKGPPECPH